MKAEQWQKLRQVLDDALGMDLGTRARFVTEACDGDEDLQREVEAILEAHDRGGEKLERPIARLVPDTEPSISRVGAYRLAKCLGEGGMGKIYLGVRDDEAFDKEVAVKILHRGHENQELLRRFRSERQILASLEHPYIAKLLDGGSTDDGRPYLVMEYVKGQPIDVFCQEGHLSLEQLLELMLKVCAAIQFAHQNLVVHRDLKPSNILVTESGEPKLLDFGIAKILSPESFSQTVLPTRTGMIPMTPEYASPEQVRGESITTATDIYALGVLLYELLSGRRPYTFSGSSLESMVELVCRQIPEKVSSAVHKAATEGASPVGDVTNDLQESNRKFYRKPETEPELGSPSRRDQAEPSRYLPRQLAGDLDAIVAKALRKEPSERYASALQLAEDLKRHFQGRPVLARRGTLAYLSSKFVHRYRLAVGSVVLAFLVLISFIAALLVQQEKILDQRDGIERQKNRAEAVSGWLLEVFSVPAPHRARGERVTARELLDKGSQSIDEASGDDRLNAELLSTMGQTYAQLGLLGEGIELLKRSIRLSRSHGGADSPELAERLQRLAEALTLQGEFHRAEKVVQEVLARALGQGPSEAAAQARAVAQLGHLRDLMGDVRQAEEHLSRALARARAYGDEALLAKVLEYSGDADMRRGDLEEARVTYSEALSLLQARHGDLHPDVALMKSNLARAIRIFDYDRSERLFEEAIATQKQLFAGAHPVLATALNNLGLLHFELARYPQAKQVFRQAIEMQSELYGEQHPKFAVMLGNLANVELYLGDSQRAQELNRQAIAIFEKSLGNEHADYALSLSNLAELLLAQGELEEASELVERAIEVTEISLGTSHARMSSILNTRGQIEMVKGQLEGARTTFELAIEIAELSWGDRHPTLPAALANLTVVLTRLEQPEAAAATMQRALTLLEQRGDPSAQRLQWLPWLANLELELERFVLAEPHAREAWQGWREKVGEEDIWTLSAQAILGRALMGLGRWEEAESLTVDLIEKLERLGKPASRRLEKARQALLDLRQKKAGEKAGL